MPRGDRGFPFSASGGALRKGGLALAYDLSLLLQTSGLCDLYGSRCIRAGDPFDSIHDLYEIIARSVFGSPTVWVMEISTYFLIFAGFLGMAYTMRKNGHICVDFLYARFSRNVRRVLDIFTSALSLFAMYVCVTESTNYMLMSYDMGIVSPSLLRAPSGIPQTAMVVGFTLLFLEILNHLLRDFFDDGKEEKL